MNKKTLITILGPTAIGKTSTGIAFAKHYKTDILSSDSRQFFKEMTIGTAVPDPEELAAAKHHFIQHISIHDNYTVGDFESEAISLLEELFQKHDTVIMVGGSGLYNDAVINGLDEFPEVPESIRKDLNKELESEGIRALQRKLKVLDPEYFEKVDIQNPHRIIRAIEVSLASGQPYSTFLNRKKPPREFSVIKIGLMADREIIYDRINRRVDIMMKQGLLNEAEGLFPFKDLNALQTVGYRELFQYMAGDFSLDHAISEIKKNSRRFAKRQLTWLRKDDSIHWVAYDSPLEEILKLSDSLIQQ
ncbi:tRNA (adenosine(37)-N6)-dimethylallyltransferase MiaA [Robertkochia solimangrovi]|uniref:tRNA (adenosine(37)-N6)-dimethylallyltransferase MiaA n=1 Tax=Robertkochia solimangrovi TaxID=2213046 RepID=UPI0011806C16|nr:tRNA (adenosine(37)-N6)-dimethylallyltransferase MiaA [Robertkochia solimangrovi]TRZ45388.1 tRNA (adenosine(37)-N6)-dimethylallyltransferase MiaA [Robertkochia solimangrovi]